jgi:hypothetical protein
MKSSINNPLSTLCSLPLFKTRKALIGAVCFVGVMGVGAVSNAYELFPMPQMKISKGSTTSGVLVSGSGYSVQNTFSGSFLTYKHQYFDAINLGWDRQEPQNISIEKAGGGIINYDDPVAIKVDRGGYIKYGKRDISINLKWSANPVYEWRIQGGQGAVQLGQPVKFFNTVSGHSAVYCYRKAGAWLKWEQDCSQADLAAAKANAWSL